MARYRWAQCMFHGALRSAIFRIFPHFPAIFHDFPQLLFACPRCVLVGAPCVPCAEVLLVDVSGGLGTAPQFYCNFPRFFGNWILRSLTAIPPPRPAPQSFQRRPQAPLIHQRLPPLPSPPLPPGDAPTLHPPRRSSRGSCSRTRDGPRRSTPFTPNLRSTWIPLRSLCPGGRRRRRCTCARGGAGWTHVRHTSDSHRTICGAGVVAVVPAPQVPPTPMWCWRVGSGQ